jgi:hypothetical protein
MCDRDQSIGKSFVGLIPSWAKCAMLGLGCGCSSVVEHQLPMLSVVGSSPFTRLLVLN